MSLFATIVSIGVILMFLFTSDWFLAFSPSSGFFNGSMVAICLLGYCGVLIMFVDLYLWEARNDIVESYSAVGLIIVYSIVSYKTTSFYLYLNGYRKDRRSE